MAKILIVYSTTDGHTLEICERIKCLLLQRHDVKLEPVSSDTGIDVGSFDKIVIGASIRYGKHHRQVYDFIEMNRHVLDDKPNAFFSVNVVARKPEKSRPETNPYLQKFLKQISWQPRHLAVFAGKINYPIYKFWDRQIIRMIMWITKGPTDPLAVVDFTDWDTVDDFAGLIARM